jgi:hypothetical protein
LGISEVLTYNDFNEMEFKLVQAKLFNSEVYSTLELHSKWSLQNSVGLELLGFKLEKMKKNRLYKSAIRLHSVKEKRGINLLEKINELFAIQDKVIIYDLTYTYLEEEKHSDCNILVLTQDINI